MIHSLKQPLSLSSFSSCLFKSRCLLSAKGFHKPYACKAHLHISSSGMHHILFLFICVCVYILCIHTYGERETYIYIERESRVQIKWQVLKNWQFAHISLAGFERTTKLQYLYPQN